MTENPEQSGEFLKYLNFGTLSLFRAANKGRCEAGDLPRRYTMGRCKGAS